MPPTDDDKKDDLKTDQKPDDQKTDDKKDDQKDDQKDNSGVTDNPELKKVVQESMKRKERIQNLEGDLEAANTKASETETKLNELETRFKGIDPEEVKKLLDDRKVAERTDLEKKGEYDRILEQVNEEHSTAITTLTEAKNAEIEELKAKLAATSGTNRELTIGRSFSDSEFVREELTLTPSKARTIYGDHFEVNEEGAVVAYDKPKGAAERTMIVDGQGKPESFANAIKKIVEKDPEHDQLIRSKLKSGTGSKTETGKHTAPEVKTGMSKIASGLKGLPAQSQPNL